MREARKSESEAGAPIVFTPKSAATVAPNVIDTPAALLLPCCPPDRACALGERACQPGPCEDKQLPEREWSLRIAGIKATEDNRDLARTNPRAEVCMRNGRTENHACAPLSKIVRQGGDRVHVLRATTQDLADARIFVRVVENGVDLYPETQIADNREGFKTSVLCRSLLLRVGPRESAPLHMYVYLD